MNTQSSKTDPQAQALASPTEPTATESLANPVAIPLETAVLSNSFSLSLDGNVTLPDPFLHSSNVDHAWPGQTFTPLTTSTNFEHITNHSSVEDLGMKNFENTGWKPQYEDTNPNLFSRSGLDLANYPPCDNWLVSDPFWYPQDSSKATNLFQQSLEPPLDSYLAMGSSIEDNCFFPEVSDAHMRNSSTPPQNGVSNDPYSSNNILETPQTQAQAEPTFMEAVPTSLGFMPSSSTRAGAIKPSSIAIHSQVLPLPSTIQHHDNEDWAHPSGEGQVTGCSGPLTRQWTLPPKRKGGRKGELTEQKKRKLQDTKVLGVCIRCRLLNAACDGQVPCGSCLARSKSTIWKQPCTKAQFLDIIQAGSYFSTSALREVATFHISGEKTIYEQMKMMRTLNQRFKVCTIEIDQQNSPTSFSWELASEFLFLALSEPEAGSSLSKPTALKISRLLGELAEVMHKSSAELSPLVGLKLATVPKFRLVNKDAVCEALSDSLGYIPGCSDFEDNPADSCTETLCWLVSRLWEITIFKDMQNSCNGLTNSSTEDKKALVNSLLFLLTFHTMVTAPLLDCIGLESQDPVIREAIHDLHDRQTRVRGALWVYVSIVMSKLPSFDTDIKFWNRAMPALQLATKETARKHQASLAEFDKEKETYHAYLHWRQRVILWNAVDTKAHKTNSENPDDETSDVSQELHDEITLEDPLQGLNKNLSEREFAIESTWQRAFVSTRVFLSLAMSHWASKASELFSSEMISLKWTSPDFIIATFSQRRDYLWLYQNYAASNSQPTPRELLLHDPDVQSTLVQNISRDKGRNFLTEDDIKTAMREGKRWQSLMDIFGPEIILVDNRYQTLEIPELIPSFNIPSFVKKASHEAFSQGKHMLSKCEWLKATCRELHGLCKQIEEWLATDNEVLSLSIGENIQARVQKVFGYPRGTKLITTQTDIIDQTPSIPEQFDGLFSDNRLDRIPGDKRWEAVAATVFARLLLQNEVMEEKKAAVKQMLETIHKNLFDALEEESVALEEWSLKMIDFIVDNPSVWSIRNLVATLKFPEQIEEFFHPPGVS